MLHTQPAWMDGWMDRWKDVWKDGWKDFQEEQNSQNELQARMLSAVPPFFPSPYLLLVLNWVICKHFGRSGMQLNSLSIVKYLSSNTW